MLLALLAAGWGEDRLKVEFGEVPQKVRVGDTISYDITLRFPDNPASWVMDSLPQPQAIGLKFVGASFSSSVRTQQGKVAGVSILSMKFVPVRHGNLQLRDGFIKLIHILGAEIDTASGDTAVSADTVIIKYPGFDVAASGGVIRFPSSGLFVLWVVSLLVMVGGIFAVARAVKVAQRIHRQPQEEKISPEKKALGQIERLSPAKITTREFTERLSRILREFIEEKWGVPALNMATREVLESLEEKGCSRHRIVLLKNILGVCDDVRFAGESLENSQLEELKRKAVEFVGEK